MDRNYYVRRFDSSGRAVDYEPFNRPYSPDSFLIYKEGDWYLAKDGKTGKLIAEDTLLSAVLAKIAQMVDSSRGAVLSFVRGEYALLARVDFPAGVYLRGNGSIIDATQVDDILFAWNANSGGALAQNMVSGMEGFVFKGIASGTAPANPNSQVAYFENIPRGVVVRDVTFYGFAKGVEIAGASFDAHVGNIRAYYSQNLVTLTTLVVDSVKYRPNGASVVDVELSNSWSNPLEGTGIHIDADIEGVHVSHAWLEAISTGIGDNGKYTTITANMISATQAGILSNGTCVRYVANKFALCDGTVGINLATEYTCVVIANNNFRAYGVDEAYAIKNTSTSGVYATIEGNLAEFTSIGLSASFYYGRLENGVISSNRITHTGENDLYLIHLTGTTYSTVVGNVLSTPKYGIVSGYRTLIQGNRVNGGAVVDYNIDEATSYCDQHMYTTLPDTSDATVSQLFLNRPIHYYDSATGTYYIAVWDGTAWRKTQLT